LKRRQDDEGVKALPDLCFQNGHEPDWMRVSVKHLTDSCIEALPDQYLDEKKGGEDETSDFWKEDLRGGSREQHKRCNSPRKGGRRL
jgi:hypothetical protein